MRSRKTSAVSARKAALFVAGIDACVVVLVAFGVALAEGKTPADFVLRRTEVLLGFVLPVAMAVSFWAWWDLRGFARGRHGLWRPAVQAFVLGFLPRPVSDGLGIVRDAFAAGPPWPTPGHSSVGEWLSYSGEVLLFASITGLLAVSIGLMLVLANRWLYVKLANMALQTDDHLDRSAPSDARR
jgi:hypothetical protein